jgi:hypothetical protein
LPQSSQRWEEASWPQKGAKETTGSTADDTDERESSEGHASARLLLEFVILSLSKNLSLRPAEAIQTAEEASRAGKASGENFCLDRNL